MKGNPDDKTPCGLPFSSSQKNEKEDSRWTELNPDTPPKVLNNLHFLRMNAEFGDPSCSRDMKTWQQQKEKWLNYQKESGWYLTT